MRKLSFLAILFFTLISCNSKIKYTKENLSQDKDIRFLIQDSEYLTGYHDYDNNIIEFDLKLSGSNDGYFKKIIEHADADEWKIVHNDNAKLILYKSIDNHPTIITFSKADYFVSIKIE